MTAPIHARDKSFPRLCRECEQLQVYPATIPYDAEVRHDGRLYSFRIPSLHVDKCAACGEILFSNVTDEQISQALREHLSLLSLTQIPDAVGQFGVKQMDLADFVAPAANAANPKERTELPLVRSATPGSLNLTGDQIAEILEDDDVSTLRRVTDR